MIKRFVFISAIALIVLATAACGLGAAATAPAVYDNRQGNGGSGGGGESAPGALPPTQDGVVSNLASSAPAAGNSTGAAQATSPDHLVVKNANLSLVVKDPVASVDGMSSLAESLGGFVVSSNISQASVDAAGHKIMQANLTVRVPVDKLNQALTQIKALAVSVNSESIAGQDVTAQYTDLESHLKNLEAAETQLQNIMDGATKTEDVLSVYNQLVAIRDQIEQVKGKMKYYSESAAMSVIAIDLIPDALSQPLEVGGWKPEGVAKDAVEALLHTLQGLANVLIWIAIYLLPLALVFGIPAYIIIRLIARRLRKKKVTTA